MDREQRRFSALQQECMAVSGPVGTSRNAPLYGLVETVHTDRLFRFSGMIAIAASKLALFLFLTLPGSNFRPTAFMLPFVLPGTRELPI
jgi:hypothetical protein